MITLESKGLAREYNINTEIFNTNESIKFKIDCIKEYKKLEESKKNLDLQYDKLGYLINN